MPTEVRHIIFTSEELFEALKIFRDRRRSPMPDAPIDRLAILSDPDIRAIVVFGPASDGTRPAPVEADADEVATAIILFCIDNKIPLPVTSSKHLQMFGGSVGLVIHKNANTVARMFPDLL